ncbi:MAG: branched-chain amino acid ABC transporter permease [Brevibacterium yomogidense]|uniref:High-affinity branched-chain amino acid transport system permease protein LivH (TC 3.A.1.4.1) n=1 Tax=Brevibacterium yomogidense TaxID=946573 RepID=A0A1X6XHW6_9MICO|nr:MULTISPECIES: branched-chain amino acid ABC transporter permease [Brevibacterium]SLM98874.1 High-affinity branched-chain amino acid transport system permease protein LivH (TC 3.A.1.4.1) [Brevibacterium yomogidense]SMX76470.1 amino acid/amide ABC transporter membrane protein 1, HAAT family [Brevibacterium sp. Mu109]
MSTFVTLLVIGLSEGAILALAALGFVLIYKATGVINFAQGEFLLIGAYSFYTAFVVMQLPIVLALLVGVLVAVVVGVVVERFILRPMVGQSHISIIMVTIGLASVLSALVQMFYGTQPRSMPPILPRGSVSILGGTVPVNRLWAIVICAVVLGLLTWFFQKSRHGVAMRAVADDQQAAMTVGISVRRVFAMSWALAAISALIAGVTLADITTVEMNIVNFGLLVFPVVIMGGLDSVPGTIVGGLTIGLVTQFVSGYMDPGLAEIVPYLVLVLVLLVRPYGVFGEKRIERV